VLSIDHRIYVSGTGSFVPERIMTNELLEDYVSNYEESEGSFAEWVDRVTHIHERRYLDQDLSSGDMAREAVRRAIESSGVDPAEIGLFVMATFTTKNLYPGEQTLLTSEFGMTNAGTFYLTAGCAGAIYGLQIGAAFLRSGIMKHVLVVGTEHLTTVVSRADPLTAILFGDGAGAVMLSRRDEEGPGGIVTHCVLGSNYVPGNIMMQNNNVPTREMEIPAPERGEFAKRIDYEYLTMRGGPRVLRTAVNAMTEAAVRSLGFTMTDLKDENPELRRLLDRAKLVPHQANGRIIDGLREKLAMSDDRIYKTVYLMGNISCASNPLTLDYAIRQGNMKRIVDEAGVGRSIEREVGPKIATGDLVLMPTVGAGYLTGCFTFVHEDFLGRGA
jgi:3-oxoacyl-[acyl-carrier-protein] synthase-3